ncbi:uncharacterized protein LOC129947195 [Eupeodes corollae]|uniref:uncharacterized protein LOC129947195 n=1 Tax=Eupeodes corollae TaxID=290404 RepID=UPI00249387BC|nr:uncharacterized protein LOC129947195 [Eupeodes corollae]
MIQISVFLFLPLTSVLAYPSSPINKNNDRYELSNEFLIRHFGSDFKDAVRFNIQPSGVPNTGNMLQKHYPETIAPNRYSKRSYELNTPQLVQQQNRMPENFMKVQLLSPAEIEALERGMKGKEMYKSPIVVTLPDFTGMTPRSINHPTLSPTVPNTAPIVYQNRMQPNYFQHKQPIWPQTPQYVPYNPSMAYQQPSRPLIEKSMQPSFEKFLMLKPTPPISFHNLYEQNPMPAKENKMEALVKPSFDKVLGTTHQQSSNESNESSQEQQSCGQSACEQSSSGHNLKEETNEPSFDQSMHQTPTEETPSSTDEVQCSNDEIMPHTDEMQPLTIKMQPSIDNMQALTIRVQPLTDNMEPLTDKLQPFTINMQPLSNSMQPSNDEMQSVTNKVQTLTEKMQPLTMNMQPSTDNMKPSNDKMQPFTMNMHPITDSMQSSNHKMQPLTNIVQPLTDTKQPSTTDKQPQSDKVHQSSSDQTQSTSELINPSNIAVPPFYRKVQATFEGTPDSYYTLRYPSYEDISSSYHPQPSNGEFKKYHRYEENHEPFFSRMTFYEKSSSSDSSRQSSNGKNHDRNSDSVDVVREVRHEYRNDKKTTA